MLARIKDIMIITTPQDHDQFKRLLEDGSQWGISLTYKIQQDPEGLAQAFILAEDFLDGAPSAMILGDNIFFGHGLPDVLAVTNEQILGATVFGYHVADPERYGVVDIGADNTVRRIIEKPQSPPSNYAITGLYFLDSTASDRAKQIKPSNRGELEITSLLETYLQEDTLRVEKMERGYAWLDTGTHTSLLDASNFVSSLIERQGLQVGSPEEVAYNLKWITRIELDQTIQMLGKNNYGKYLEKI